MSLDDSIPALIAGAYAAALDDSLWLPWSERAIEVLGGAGGSFIVLDPRSRALQHMANIRVDAKVQDEYLANELWRLDPQIPYACSLNQSGIYLDSDHVDLTDPAAAEHAAFLRAKAGWGHHMTSVARLNQGQMHACLSVHRRVADGPTPQQQQRMLAALLPEMVRAMELGFIHAAKLSDAYWDGLLTDRADPAVLLDAKGAVIRMTPKLSALLSRGDGLDIVGNRLRAAIPEDDARLQAFVGRAVLQQGGASGAVRISRRLRPAPLLLTAFPLPRHNRLIGPAAAAALVTIIDPAAQISPPLQRFQMAFGLTEREGELAGLLLAGHSAESASHVMQVQLPTVRIHLRRLLAKTNTARQLDLLRLLMRLYRAAP